MSIFSGRINRTTYLIAYLVITIIAFIAFSQMSENSTVRGLIILIANVAYLPFGIKRLHDIGMSAWFVLLLFIPILGTIAGFMLIFQPGQTKTNKYGSVPQ